VGLSVGDKLGLAVGLAAGLSVGLAVEMVVGLTVPVPAVGLPVAVPKIPLVGDLVDFALPVLPAPAFTTVVPFVFNDFGALPCAELSKVIARMPTTS
jgi:hypothetical protein